MPSLFIVATPIGNMEDITLRALNVLREVTLIAAEDTRRTRQILERYDIDTRMTSYHEHNKLSKLEYILESLSQGDVALVSDAGMPGISDPGYELINAVIEKGIAVVPIPGPSVVVTAVAVSGLPADCFSYVGFLPNRAGARLRLLESLKSRTDTLVMFEAPHRLPAALEDIQAVLGDRKITVCRELTKLHEEIFRGTVSEAARHFTAPKGELVLVIAGKQEQEKPEITGEIETELLALYRSGETARGAVTRVASRTGLSRRELYRTWLRVCSDVNPVK